MSHPAIVWAAVSGSDMIDLLVGCGVFITGALLVLGLIAIMVWFGDRRAARRTERETALKKELLDRGLSVEEIERLIRATVEPLEKPAEVADEDVDALGELGGILGQCEPIAKPETIEEILTIARTADTKMKRAMLRAVEGMHAAAGTISDEQVLAAVRALARPAEPSSQSTTTNDFPGLAGTASRITDAFRLPE